MSYEGYGGRAYRELKLIEGINLLVNTINRRTDDKETLKEVHENWIKFNNLSFADQLELIYGTATDNLKCRYMVNCINDLNGYMMDEYPNNIKLIKKLSQRILAAINMAIMADAHIWRAIEVESVLAAFKSSRVAKSSAYYEPKELEDRDNNEKPLTMEYFPNK